MAKKDLRAQMDAARAAAAFIGAAQEAQEIEEAPDRSGRSAGALSYELVSTGQEGEGAAAKRAARGDDEVEEGLQGEGDAVRAAASPQSPEAAVDARHEAADVAPEPTVPNPAARQVKSAASDVTMPASTPDFFVAEDEALGSPEPASKAAAPAPKPKATRPRKPRKKAPEPVEEPAEGSPRMTAQVLVPMTAEQREHADLLAQVMKVTRAEVMRQALDEYWNNHKAELQAAVVAYEQLIKKLMK